MSASAMEALNLIFVVFLGNFLNIQAHHHWIVTENGKTEVKVDTAFPLRRSYDLLAVLEQEERAALIEKLDERLERYKSSLKRQYEAVKEESDFEKRMYSTDRDCVMAQVPLSKYELVSNFFDKILPNRPILPAYRLSEEPPDCTKYAKIDFSLLMFPHLKSMREPPSESREIESDAPMQVDLAAMLEANATDWTAYNLASHYWQVRRNNATKAIACAQRAVHFAPRWYRFLPLLNLGTLLQSCQKLAEAAIVLHAAVDLDPSQHLSHMALGHVYALVGDYDRSAACYNNAATLRPEIKRIQMHRAAVICHQKLTAGLYALDESLQKTVDELHDYGELHQRKLHVQAELIEDRAIGRPFEPLSAGVGELWHAINQQALMLDERLKKIDPLAVGTVNREHNSSPESKSWRVIKVETSQCSAHVSDREPQLVERVSQRFTSEDERVKPSLS